MLGPGISINVEELIELQPQAARLSLFQSPLSRESRAGEFRSRYRQRGMDFAEVRAYQMGDDIRQMDWRVTARTGEPHIKLFEEERDLPFFLCVDQRVSMRFGTRVAFKSVVAAKLTALYAWSAKQANFRVGGIILKDDEIVRLPAKGGRLGVFRLLQAMAEATQSDLTKSEYVLTDALRHCRQLASPGSVVVVMSDFLGDEEGVMQQLSFLSRYHQVMLVQVYDPLEKNLPPPGRYVVTDGKSRLMLSTDNKKSVAAYRDNFEKKLASLESLAHKERMGVLSIATNDDILLPSLP
jgi:uncharacterized protein (DUF58 family)